MTALQGVFIPCACGCRRVRAAVLLEFAGIIPVFRPVNLK
jgi:hypothetical protein